MIKLTENETTAVSGSGSVGARDDKSLSQHIAEGILSIFWWPK